MSNENGTERVTQMWPLELKKKVQAKVGTRGVTRYTLEAVRERIAREEAAETLKEALGDIDEIEEAPAVMDVAPEPVAEQPGVPVEVAPTPRASKLIGGETRGAELDVQTVSTGASQEYGSSRARVEAMLAKAASMGVKKAAELSVPPKPKLVEVVAPDEVVEEGDDEPFDPNAYDQATPADQLTLQEQLAQTSSQPEPISTPARNLDAVEVDF